MVSGKTNFQVDLIFQYDIYHHDHVQTRRFGKSPSYRLCVYNIFTKQKNGSSRIYSRLKNIFY